MGSYDHVAAVVVTWNRIDLLKQALAAIEGQTRPVDLLIVVDNASTDGTGAYLAERSWSVPHVVFSLTENTGGAGGFARGLDEAVRCGHAAWLLDDDGIPAPDALAVMIEDAAEVAAATGREPAFACSAVEWSDGSAHVGNVPKPWSYWSQSALATGRAVVDVRTASFVSVLVPPEHARGVGLPYAEYHKWYDDAEYTFRLTRRYGPGLCSLNSRVRHHTVRNEGTEAWTAAPEAIPAHALAMRNRLSASVTTRNPHAFLELVRDCGRVARSPHLTVRQRATLLRGAVRGIAFRPPVRPAGASAPATPDSGTREA